MGIVKVTSDEYKEQKGNLFFVIFISCAAAFGGLLYGYDTAVISGAIGLMEVHFNLSPTMVGFVVSSLLFGGAVGVLSSGKLSDRFGRKGILLLAASLFIVSAIMQALSSAISFVIISRIIGGLGIGMASVLSITYISEIAPPHMRGRLGSLYQFAVAVGIVSVYFVNDYILSIGEDAWQNSTGWRYIIGASGIPALLFLLILSPVPESPRWLVKANRTVEAMDILIKINGTHIARQELYHIEQSLKENQPASLSLFKEAGLRKALLIGILLAAFQQLVGINAIIYYAPQVFEAAGAIGDLSLLVTSMIGVAAFLGVLCSMWLIDRIGRKALLLIGTAGMAVTQLLVSFGFHSQGTEGLTTSLLIVFYLFLFNISMGPVVWVVISEIFPNHARGYAMSISTFFLWIANWFVSQFFPILWNKAGGSFTFLSFMIMCIASFLFIWKWVPETKGKSLEEIEHIWK
ncbi:sugar porter family MFS transporter [Priestia aryabhattai]|uniref:sugar porter family MFS transporter n=1 Tax=Priestia aryabhattai TaxID=412384 RepID=UPI003D26CC3E